MGRNTALQAEQNRDWHRKRHAAGRCHRCGRLVPPAREGRWTCVKCGHRPKFMIRSPERGLLLQAPGPGIREAWSGPRRSRLAKPHTFRIKREARACVQAYWPDEQLLIEHAP